jgi:hypothetical protein
VLWKRDVPIPIQVLCVSLFYTRSALAYLPQSSVCGKSIDTRTSTGCSVFLHTVRATLNSDCSVVNVLGH